MQPFISPGDAAAAKIIIKLSKQYCIVCELRHASKFATNLYLGVCHVFLINYCQRNFKLFVNKKDVGNVSISIKWIKKLRNLVSRMQINDNTF